MPFFSWSSLLKRNLAVDLGTVNTLVFVEGQGIVLNEPSVVAVNDRTGEVEAVGTAAEQMRGRTPELMRADRPMRHGAIADLELAGRMLSHFVRKAMGNKLGARARVVVAVPCALTEVERHAVSDSLLRSAASEVHLIDEPLAAALGADLPVSEPWGSMVVDVGGGLTEVAVLSLSGIVFTHSVPTAGTMMDWAVLDHIKRHHRLLVGERTAEQVKMAVGSALPLDEPLTTVVKGKNVGDGIPRRVTITDAEVREAITPQLDSIVGAVRVALEQTPPELSADLVQGGITLTGGGALLRGLDRRISQATGLPVKVADNPLSSVVLGAAKMFGGLVRRRGR